MSPALLAAAQPLGLLYGALIGLALGLTGGGGSLLAVPLLVYGLGVSASQAVGTSLAAVGAVAAAGAVQRWRAGQLETRVGLIFAAGGMLGAPVGSWLGRRIPQPALLTGFALLMVAIAARMWRQAVRDPRSAAAVRARVEADGADDAGPFCRFDPAGRIRLDSRCGRALVVAGLLAGVLSGLFGVGGGFIIVPALVFFTGMSAHRAVATSLLVIALVCASGVASFFVGGGALPLGTTALFVVGGLAGMAGGTLTARRLSAAGLQKVFAVAIVAVAVFVLIKNLTA